MEDDLGALVILSLIELGFSTRKKVEHCGAKVLMAFVIDMMLTIFYRDLLGGEYLYLLDDKNDL